MITVTVCVGSSCHVKGARKVIACFSDLLKKHGLEEKVMLKGCFCMERCGEGVNWKINGDLFTSARPEDAAGVFEERIVRPLKGGGARGKGKRGQV